MIVPLLQRERSIDDFIDKDDGFRLAAVLADRSTLSQEDKLYQKEVQILVQAAYHRLEDRERYIIRNRFGLLGGKEQTLEEIGHSLNLSRERVRQVEREAKGKLRGALRRFETSVVSQFSELCPRPLSTGSEDAAMVVLPSMRLARIRAPETFLR